MAANKINFDISYTVNKNGLNELKSALNDIQKAATKAANADNLSNELDKAAVAARRLEEILSQSWNYKLNQLDLSKFNTSVKEAFGGVNQLKSVLESCGSVGTTAYNKVASSILNTNLQLKQSNQLLNEMATTMSNTIKWGIASSVMNRMTGSIQEALGFTQSLDRSLNDIRIVTEKSADDMANFAVQANSAAQGLAASTTDYTNASLIYYQQGLSDEEVQARTETTLKTANVTQQTAAEVSELLTAVWNGYKVSADEAEEYVDKLAAVAATTASDLEELSTGMSRVASAAAAMGVDVDQLNAQLATIVSVTRQAPESVGTALRSIYARMGQLKADGEDDFGVTLGNYTKQMKDMGIEILDQQGNMREMGEVIEEVAGKWQGWTQAQKNAAAQAMAGTRQYNNLVALFDNWDMYTNALETSQNALGALQKQQDIYLDSTQAKLQQLDTKLEETFQLLINSDTVNSFAGGMGKALDGLNNLLGGLDNGANRFIYFGSIITNIFNKQIAGAIERQIQNIRAFNENAMQAQLKQQIIDSHAAQGNSLNNKTSAAVVELEAEYAQKLLNIRELLTQEEYNQLTNQQQEIGLLEQEIQEESHRLELENFQKSATQTTTEFLREREQYLREENNDAETMLSILALQRQHAQEMTTIDASRLETEDQRSLRVAQIAELSQLNIQDEEALLALEVSHQTLMQGRELTEEEILSLNQDMVRVLEAVNAQYATQEEQVQAIAALLDKVGKQGGLDALTKGSIGSAEQQKNIATITQGLSTISMLVSSTIGLVGTLGDESLSSGEKAERVISTLMFSLPMLISNLGVIKDFLPAIAAELGVVTAEGTGLLGAIKAIEIAIGPVGWVIEILGAAAAGLAIYNSHQEKVAQQAIDDAKAIRDEAIAYEQEAEAVNSSYEAYRNLYNTYKTTGEGKQELDAKTQELCETYDVEINRLDLLAGRYDKINQKIAEARQQKAEEATNTAKSGLENAGEALLGEGLTSSGSKSSDNRISFDDAGLVMNDEFDFWKELSNSLNEQLKDLVKSGDIEIADETNAAVVSGIDSAQEFLEIYKAIDNAMSDIANGMTEIDPNDLEGSSEAYQQAREWLSSNRDNYEKYVQLQKDLEEYSTELAAANTELVTGGIQLEDIDSLESFEQYRQQFIDELNRAFREDGIKKDQEEVKNIADEYLATIDSVTEYLNEHSIEEGLHENLNDSQENIEKFIQELRDSDELNLVATLQIDEGASIDEIRKAVSAASQEAAAEFNSNGLISVAEALTELNENGSLIDLEDDVTEVFEGFLDTSEGIRGASTAMEEWRQVSEEGIVAQIEYLEDLQEAHYGEAEQTVEATKLQKEAELDYLKTKEERLNSEQEEMDKLEERVLAYERLRNAMGDNFDENARYAQALFESAEAEEEAKQRVSEFANEMDNTKAAIASTTDELNNTDWDFEITIAGVEELVRVGDSIVSEAEKIKEATSLIGEGFIVSADNAEQLAAVYPALLQDAQVLADGQIQLSQASVDKYLGDQSILLEGDKTTAIARIDNEIEVLNSKKASAEAELAMYKSVAEGDLKLTKEQIEKISTGRQKLTNYLINLGVDENKANSAVAEAMAGNYDELARIVTENSSKIDENLSNAVMNAANNTYDNAGAMIDSWNSVADAATNAWQAAEGQGNSGNVTNRGRGGSKNDQYSYEATEHDFNISNPNLDTEARDFLDDAISDTKLDISSYEQSIARLKALKSQLLASSGKAQETLSNARSGLGGYTNQELEDKNKSNIDSSKASKEKSTDEKEEKEEEVKDPDYIEYLEDEADRYHDIDLRIQEVERSLDRLQDQQKKLFGKDLLDNLNEQLNVLEQQKGVYQDKINLAKQEAQEIRDSLSSQGVTFNEDGSISNYAQALSAKLEYVNDVIDEYNALSAEEQEGFKSVVDAAKQEYEDFKDQIEQYDELTSSTIPDLQDKIREDLDKQIELQIEKFNMEIEIRLDMAEAEREYLDFKKKVIDGIKETDVDYILKNAKANLTEFQSYFNTNGTEIGPIQALTGWSSEYGDDKASLMEDLKEYYSELMKNLEDVEDLVDEIKDSYLDMIDEAIEKFDKQVDQYEYIDDLINHDMNIIGLVYGDDAYEQMAKYYDKIEQNNIKELDFLRQRVDYAYKMMQAETDPQAREKWEKEWQNSLKQLYEETEDTLNSLVDKYDNTINQIFDKLENKVTNGLGLDYIGEEWELINENAEAYLDTINGMYAIQELENKYLDALNAEDSIAGQQKLNDLMNEQLAMLREKDKLTQYDVDRANLLFEIALKEIALQNAQQNKSNMRLRRDAQGNYSYQFVSDEESISQAQKDLAEAQNELYNLDVNQYKQNQDDIYSATQEFLQKMAEAAKLSGEERARTEELITEQYQERINGLTEQNIDIRNNLYDSAFRNLADMYDVDISNFTDLTREEQDLIMQDLVPQWDSGVQQMTDKFAGEGGFIETCQDGLDELKQSTEDYQLSLEALQDAAGLVFESLAEGHDMNIDRVEDLLYENDALIDQYGAQVDAILEVINQLDALIDQYESARDAAIEATNAAYSYWQQENANAASAAANDTGTVSATDVDVSTGGTDQVVVEEIEPAKKKSSSTKKKSSSSKKKTSGGNNIPEIGDVVTYTGGLYYYDSYGSAPTGNRGPGKKVTITHLNPGAPFPIHVESSDSAFGWLKQSQIKGYDTGGYTGNWGNGGRLGILHEKELVLNSSDTENILSAVEVIRSMDSLVNGLNQSMFARLAGMAINMGGNIPVPGNSDNIVQQDVRITAEFPGVRDSKEIENAFNNLVNVASQYAFNNRR